MADSVLASTNIWSDRVASGLGQADPRSAIVCHSDSGIKWAIRRLELAKTPLIRIWIENDSETMSDAEILAKSINRAVGFKLAPPGVAVSNTIEVLQDFARRVGSIQVVVGWLEHCQSLVTELLGSDAIDMRIIVVASSQHYLIGKLGLSEIKPDLLEMRPEEALVAKSSGIEEAFLEEAYQRSNGQFGAFLRGLDEMKDFVKSPNSELTPAVSKSSPDPFAPVTEALIRALWDKGRLVEAFELACTECTSLVSELVDRAGNYFFDRGAFYFLWDCIRGLPASVLDSPNVAYWLYASAAATNQLAEVQHKALNVLSKGTAPELRAAVAVMRPDTNVDRETAKAIRESESPTTVRARAFALALGGDRHGPILLLRRAMALAEGANANHSVIACALDISNQEITLGRLRSGRDWARWALRQYDARQLSEGYRRQTALAGLAFAGILIGEHEDVKKTIEMMEPNLAHLGVPTYESVISTIGDWYLHIGDSAQAEYYYGHVLANAPMTQYASASLDVVKSRIAQGDNLGALDQAGSAYSLSRSSSMAERAFGSLALGMAIFNKNPISAVPHLQEAARGFAETNYAIFEAQALVWLALGKIVNNELSVAKRILESVSPITADFGLSGWQFLIANSAYGTELQSVLSSSKSGVHLKFLGDSTVLIGSEQIRPSRRHCEILALLIDRPKGVSSEQLQLLLYGDLGKPATAKATVSRLRKIIPISTAPYKLLANVEADFSQVLRNIEEGQLQKALLSYRGPLLPESDAPGIVELRDHISEIVRSAVIASADPDLLIDLGHILEDDLEVWEFARANLSHDDRRRPLVAARIRRVKSTWS